MIATPLASPDTPGISLWLVDLDAPAADARNPLWTAVLSEAEKAKANRFHFEHDARRYRVSHIALREVLAQATGTSARSLVFEEGPFGKPRLPGAQALHFNMSHGAGWGLIGVCADAPIGVDIEIPREMSDLDALAGRNFTRAECESLRAVAPGLQLDAFLRCWTRKEACLKAVGSGLSIEPAVFEAGIETTPRWTTIEVNGQACGMSVHTLRLPMPGLAACARISEAGAHLAM